MEIALDTLPNSFWTKDTVRMFPRPRERSIAHGTSEKRCLACNHWVKSHWDHGACTNAHCKTCLVFVDPEPGRPDIVFTREQVDKMRADRYRVYRDKLYLMKDGRYGILDRWTDTSLFL